MNLIPKFNIIYLIIINLFLIYGYLASSEIQKIESTLTIQPTNQMIELSLANNTGISLAYNTFVIISATNLSYTITSDSDISQYVKFEIIKQSQFGCIEKLRANGRWVNVSSFSQRQINRNKIRYFHLKDKPKQDLIELQVTYNQIKAPIIHFEITFKTSQLKSIVLNQLTINQETGLIAITNEYLKFDTRPTPTDTSLIIYTILSIPSYGSLNLIINNATETLTVGSFFTQKMIDDKTIYYNCSQSAHTSPSGHDFFDFEVVTEDGLTNVEVTGFHFKFIRSTSDVFTLINEKLVVIEGDRATITSTLLKVDTANKVGDITYNITNKPKFGTIKVLNQRLNDVMQVSPDQLTQQEINENRVVYYHDDSENSADVFDFVAVDSENSYICFGTFTVNVVMKNDNPPIRVVDKVFHVVIDGQKRLTTNDMKYIDSDIDSLPINIVYSKTYIPNGNLYFVDRPNVVADQFTQEDINKENILFKHSGDENGRAILWITDGQFYASGVLEIKASRPFLKVSQNTGLVVKYGESAVITAHNLSIDTNLDITRKSDVTIKITSEPKFGQLLNAGKETNRFNLQDLIDENIEYESKAFAEDSLVVHNDFFTFRLFFNGEDYLSGRANAENEVFNISIYPHSYFQLSLINLKNISADEDKFVLIDSSQLLVSHQTLDAESIVYMITQLPKFGSLSLLTHNTTPVAMHFPSRNAFLSITKTSSVSKEALLVFTQKDINDGLIHYKYSQSDNDVQRNSTLSHIDYIRFDVSNGITTLRDLTLYINIISKIITIQTSNITVVEGQSVVLTGNDIVVSNDFYANLIDEYLIIEDSKFGRIVCIGDNEEKKSTKTFTPNQLRNNQIWYEHNGSETTRDWLTIVVRVNSLNKESLPSTIHVFIEPINDETPHVVNNTGIEIWEGTSAVITNSMLAAVDDDSVTKDIVYQISTPSNGYVITGDNKQTPIERFTQIQIDSGIVMYVHSGELAGGFRFQVTDGLNFDSPHVFTVTAKSVAISVIVNKKLYVFPRMQQSVTRDHLLVETNDGDNSREFTYHIIREPKFGRFLLENSDGSTKPVMSFTQTQINKNFILYEQNKQMDDILVEDEITFEVESHFVQTLKGVKFVVEIAVGTKLGEEMPTEVLTHTDIMPLTVIEGQFAVITEKNLNITKLVKNWQKKELNAKLIEKFYMKLWRKPSHGVVLYEGHDMSSRIKSIPLSALTQNSLIYKHDSSNTFNDSIVFNVFIRNGIEILVTNHTIDINIIPVNDELPILLTTNPRIEVIYGTKTLISNAMLRVSDEDGMPQNIIYDLNSGGSPMRSNSGYFMIDPIEEPVNTFTQFQIDSNRVYYKHNGTQSTQQITFRIKDEKSVCGDVNDSITTDANHCTPIYAMTIVVQQLTLTLFNHSTIHLPQGSIKAKIRSKHLGTVSNDIKPENIVYYIKDGPINGYLIVNDRTNNEKFTQKDINSLQVSYIQINKTSTDYFIVDIVRDNTKQTYKAIKNVTVMILVKPLVKANKPYLIANPGKTSYLTPDHLDASELAYITQSVPKFTITANPKFGILRKFSSNDRSNRVKRKSNSHKLLPNIEFTNEDIMNGRIAYIADNDLDLSYPNEMLTDVIHYDLGALNVQTVSGVLVINVIKTKGFNTKSIDQNLRSNISLLGEEIGIFERSDDMNYLNIIINRDHLLIVFVFIVVVILTIALIVIIRVCHSSATQLASHKDNKSGPIGATLNTSPAILETPPVSDYGGAEMLIMSNRLSPRSTPSMSEAETGHHVPMAPPTSPSFSPNCSILEGRSRTSTPRSLLRLPMADRLRGYAAAAYDMSPDPAITSILPLPPPSLYFANEPNVLSDNWDHNSVPMRKVTPTVSSYIGDHYCGSYHHSCPLNERSMDMSPIRALGDGTSLSGSPVPSLRKPLWSSQDFLPEFNSSIDCPNTSFKYNNPNEYNCKTPNSDVYITDNFSADCLSLQHNLGQMEPKPRDQYWV